MAAPAFNGTAVPVGHSSGQPGVNSLFLLIDAAQYPGIWRILQYRFRRLPWANLADEDNGNASAPVLLHVTSNQTRTLAWFLEHTKGLHCLSWIDSPLGLGAMREHLRSMTRVEAADCSRYEMRYYDTRILPAWYQMLDTAQEAHALGPVNSWTYLDRDGLPCTLFGHAHAQAPVARTLQLTVTQERALLEATLPDIILEYLEQNGNADLAAMPHAQRYGFIADQVKKATSQYGICTTQEIALFCSLALGIGRNFDRLLPVAQVLQKFAGSAGGNYVALQGV
ncbi:DUF4123 domain-containing protein [Janthinobacterium sp. 17J80-10]|uniref:DUF4123 domain-containing protein n=1 Tax=Janthinobacterium sp. 17J80-10 TaxID=2497863 RepID=UPI00100565CB|nr:DUF4123 domain-containing protein [Janthinobacterium sp. 17J80-10]QAU34392.1 DUF4123 domain-containing protein [Janthinobacterium sp. 17J80-10]